MSEPAKRNIGNAFLGISLLLMLLGWLFVNKSVFAFGFTVGVLWLFGKLVAFIARSLGLK